MDYSSDFNGVRMWKFQPALCLYVLILAVAVKSAGTPANIDEIFLGRCHEYQQVMRPDLFVNGFVDYCRK